MKSNGRSQRRRNVALGLLLAGALGAGCASRRVDSRPDALPSNTASAPPPVGDGPHPGVTVVVPPEVPAAGPIPVQVTMVADMRTYWDNDGILDKALTVVLVRRDRPGVRFLPKIDPRVAMMPDPPLPDRPSEAALARDPSRMTAEKTLDPLEYGVPHPGAAEYYVVAGFSSWSVDRPARLKVTDETRVLPATQDKPPAIAGARLPRPPRDRPGLTARVVLRDGALAVEGAFRALGHSRLWAEERDRPPFITVVALRIAPKGGASAGVFAVTADREDKQLVGTFSVPARLLVPTPSPGRYRVFTFLGDEQAPTFEAELVR